MPHLSNSRSTFDEVDLSALFDVGFAIQLCSGLLDPNILKSKCGYENYSINSGGIRLLESNHNLLWGWIG